MIDVSALSFEEQAASGFAHYWAENAELEPVQYNDDPAEAFTSDGGVGISLFTFPQVPGPTVTMTPYVVSDDPSLSDSVLGIQLYIWSADVSQLMRLAGDPFNLFQGLHGVMLGSVKLVQAVRSSGAILGLDTNGRRGRTENYYLTMHRPSPNRQ